MTLTHRRTGDITADIDLGRRIRGEGYPDTSAILYSSGQLFRAAVAAHQEYGDHGLSITGAMTVAMVDPRDIDTVLSFDDNFDGVVDRLEPATVFDS